MKKLILIWVLGLFMVSPLLSQIELVNQDFKRMMNAPRSILKPFHVNEYYCIEFPSSITCVTTFEHKQYVELKFFKEIPQYIFVYFRNGKARRINYFDYTGNCSDINGNLVDFLIDVVELDLYKEKKH